jgi:hypothetical protein
MDSLVLEEAEKDKNGKRKRDNHCKGNDHRNKRHATTRAYTMGDGDKKNYNGDAPKCGRCYKNHSGRCNVVCQNCSKMGHIAKDCRARPLAMVQATPEAMSKANVTCYGCGKKRHYRNECRESWNRGNQGSGGNGYNHGNRGAGGNRGRQDNGDQRVEAGAAHGRVYALGNERGEDPNVVTGTFLLNNRYASILFDTGADKSFVSLLLHPY